MLFVMYVNDGIFYSPKLENIDKAIQDLHKANCDIDNQGKVSDYLDVQINSITNTIYLTQ